MDFNSKKIKNLMKDDNSNPLPPELGWDTMKEGIFAKMQAAESVAESTKPPKKSQRKLGLLLLFLALFLTIPIVLFYPVAETQNNKTAKPMDRAKVPAKAENTDSKPAVKTKNNKETFIPLSSDLKEVVSPASIQNKDQSANPSAQIPSVDQAVGKLAATKDLHSLKGKEIWGTEKITSEDSSTLNDAHLTFVLKPWFDLGNLFLNKTPPIKVTPRIDLDSASSFSGDFWAESGNTTLQKRSRKNFPNQLILEGGITVWNEGFGDSKPANAQYQRTISSFQIQGYYTKYLKADYFVLSGFQYQQLESKFQYQTIINDYPITISDALVQVQNNLISGQYENIYRDVETTVQAQRRIIHYNKTRLFKVSFAVGKSWQFRGLQADLYLGAALNTFVNNQGRMLHQDSILDYQGVSNSVFQNQMMIDALMGARLHYFLTGSTAITAGFQGQRSVTNWSNQAEIRLYPWSAGLQLGMSYYLD